METKQLTEQNDVRCHPGTPGGQGEKVTKAVMTMLASGIYATVSVEKKTYSKNEISFCEPGWEQLWTWSEGGLRSALTAAGAAA